MLIQLICKQEKLTENWIVKSFLAHFYEANLNELKAFGWDSNYHFRTFIITV